jgi:hypothetical protein
MNIDEALAVYVFAKDMTPRRLGEIDLEPIYEQASKALSAYVAQIVMQAQMKEAGESQ